MKFFDEFKEFAVKGNALDLAVGVVIGAAFQKITDSLVNDILLPPIGALTGKVDLNGLFINLSDRDVTTIADAKLKGIPTLNYGLFLNQVISFFLVALALFLFIKTMNRLRRINERKEEALARKARK